MTYIKTRVLRNPVRKLTGKEKAYRGEYLADILHLMHSTSNFKVVYRTKAGMKTSLRLFELVERIVRLGSAEKQFRNLQ